MRHAGNDAGLFGIVGLGYRTTEIGVRALALVFRRGPNAGAPKRGSISPIPLLTSPLKGEERINSSPTTIEIPAREEGSDL
jgi:hypothetical protein